MKWLEELIEKGYLYYGADYEKIASLIEEEMRKRKPIERVDAIKEYDCIANRNKGYNTALADYDKALGLEQSEQEE